MHSNLKMWTLWWWWNIYVSHISSGLSLPACTPLLFWGWGSLSFRTLLFQRGLPQSTHIHVLPSLCHCPISWLSIFIHVHDSLWPRGLQPTRLLHPWEFPGKHTGVGCHFLFQEIFPTQGLNPGLPHYRQTLSIWGTREAPQLPHYLCLSCLLIWVSALFPSLGYKLHESWG